jgi:ComF family protein
MHPQPTAPPSLAVSVASRVKSCIEAGVSFFYPDACQHCGEERATAAEGYIGAECARLLKFIRAPFCDRCGIPFEGAITQKFECSNCKQLDLRFSRARSVVAAKDMALEIIHRYKYQHALWFEPFLAGLLIDHAAETLRAERWDLIVPVPLHPAKHAEREFNQAGRLARRLGEAIRIPVDETLVQRARPTRTQTHLSATERAENVRRAFTPIGSATCQGRRVVVVDDVFTTGATTSACAGVLLGAGAAEVCVWTVARGLLQ